jgi:hypothetical protein
LQHSLAKECNEALFKLTSEGPSVMYVKSLEERLIKIENRQIKSINNLSERSDTIESNQEAAGADTSSSKSKEKDYFYY